MIETLDNVLQLVVAGVCCIYAVIRAVKTSNRAWIVYALFCAGFFLGDLYWSLYLILYGNTPMISYIPDLSWDAAYLFMILLVQNLLGRTRMNPDMWQMWTVPVFVTVAGIFFITKGDYLANIVTSVLMGIIMWNALKGIEITKNKSHTDAPEYYVFRLTMIYCVLEYLLWISSYFWMGDTLINPYFWFDTMITITIALFIPAIRRAVNE